MAESRPRPLASAVHPGLRFCVAERLEGIHAADMRRIWSGYWVVLIVCLGAAGCRVSRPEQGHKLGWRTLSRGLTSGLATPLRTVIRDEGAWYRLWAEHASEMNRVALPPAVSFTNEMVVALALGQRPTGGYLVEVVDVELRGRTVRVLVGERKPLPGTIQMQQATRPYMFVALPAMNARVDFRDVSEAEMRQRQGVRRAGGTSETEGAKVSRPVTPVDSPRGSVGRAR